MLYIPYSSSEPGAVRRYIWSVVYSAAHADSTVQKTPTVFEELPVPRRSIANGVRCQTGNSATAAAGLSHSMYGEGPLRELRKLREHAGGRSCVHIRLRAINNGGWSSKAHAIVILVSREESSNKIITIDNNVHSVQDGRLIEQYSSRCYLHIIRNNMEPISAAQLLFKIWRKTPWILFP